MPLKKKLKRKISTYDLPYDRDKKDTIINITQIIL